MKVVDEQGLREELERNLSPEHFQQIVMVIPELMDLISSRFAGLFNHHMEQLIGRTTKIRQHAQSKKLDRLSKELRGMTKRERSCLFIFGGVSNDELERIAVACEQAAAVSKFKTHKLQSREEFLYRLKLFYDQHMSDPATGYENGPYIAFVKSCLKVLGEGISNRTLRNYVSDIHLFQ